MKTVTKKRLVIATAAGVVAVLALLIFGAGFTRGGARARRAAQRQFEEARADEAARAAAERTFMTIGEGSVAASTAPIKQGPCD
jgi:hypothetical protein